MAVTCPRWRPCPSSACPDLHASLARVARQKVHADGPNRVFVAPSQTGYALEVEDLSLGASFIWSGPRPRQWTPKSPQKQLARYPRQRVKAPVESKSAAKRWAEARQAELLKAPSPTQRAGEQQQHRVMPTLREFGPRYIENHARADQLKASTVDWIERTFRNHLYPVLGDTRLDRLGDEDVQRLKARLTGRHRKTVNNVLGILGHTLKTAAKWKVIDRVPCTVAMLKVSGTLVNRSGAKARGPAIDRRHPHPAPHVLLAPGDAGRAGEGHPGTRRARRSYDGTCICRRGRGRTRSRCSTRGRPCPILETLWRPRAAESISNGNCLDNVVGARGFEPPTPRSRTECATRLRYAPIPPRRGRATASARGGGTLWRAPRASSTAFVARQYRRGSTPVMQRYHPPEIRPKCLALCLPELAIAC